METWNPNYDRHRILEWLNDCGDFLSRTSPYDDHLDVEVESVQFDNRTCSPVLPEQLASCGHSFEPASGHTDQPAARTLSSFDTSAVPPSVKQSFLKVALALQSSTWIKFYGLCKQLHPHLSNKFSEHQVNNALIKAIMKRTVSFETILSMKEAQYLSDTQRRSLHLAFHECVIENPSPTSPKTERAILIKKAAQSSSSDSGNYPELRQELNRLKVNSATIEQIIALKPYDIQFSVLERLLKNVIGLDDDKAHMIACHVRFLSPVDRAINGRQQQISGHQDKKVSSPTTRQVERLPNQGDFEDDVALATKFSLRNIGDSKFTTLVVGSSINGSIADTYDHETTLFAYSRHSDLNGDIHNTVDDIPPGKQFKTMHFVNMSESTFDDPKKNRVLFYKLSNLLADYGKIIVSFAANGQGYNDQTFAERILKPSGFSQFCFPGKSSPPRSNVNIIATKTGVPQPLVPESEETVRLSALSIDCSGVVPVQQRPNQVWKEYTLDKKKLINMMQSPSEPIDHDLIQKALSSPANPEYDLSIDEFATLKVRYDAWHVHKPSSGLPFNNEIRDLNERLREARELYKALVDHQEEGCLTDARPGTTPVLHDLTEPHLQPAAQNTATRQQIDKIIKALNKEFTGLKADIVSRHIPCLALSEEEINQAVDGRKSALDKILIESQIRESCYPTSNDQV